jgi:hypothetical protein
VDERKVDACRAYKLFAWFETMMDVCMKNSAGRR